jgi:hypothetical protein
MCTGLNCLRLFWTQLPASVLHKGRTIPSRSISPPPPNSQTLEEWNPVDACEMLVSCCGYWISLNLLIAGAWFRRSAFKCPSHFHRNRAVWRKTKANNLIFSYISTDANCFSCISLTPHTDWLWASVTGRVESLQIAVIVHLHLWISRML